MTYQAHSCQRRLSFLHTYNFSKSPPLIWLSHDIRKAYLFSSSRLLLSGIQLTSDNDSMYYNHLILTIYEPLLDMKTDQEPSPRQIVADAQKYLQTLVRLYYLRHGFDAMNLFIVIPLMLAGQKCIEAIDEQTPLPELEVLRSTLILVAKGLYSQRRNHYLAEALYRVIRGRMRPAEVGLLRGTMDMNDIEGDEKRDMVQAVRSHWPVSVVRKKEDLDAHILTNLVESYAHLNVTPKEGLTVALDPW